MKRITLALMLAGVFGLNQAMAANAIIENEYVRAGVNESTGTLGSGGGTRPGLQYDNTGTSTWPSNSSQGDYLTPGSPFEGYTVRLEEADGTLIRSYTNNNTGARSITDGAWVTAPTAASAIWSATTSDFGIQNTYSLPAGQKYIEIDTQITASIAIPKLWFGRFIDPDAMPMPGDTSATDNARGYGAIPTTNVVFSEATVSRYALGLYSSATNVDTGISPMWTTNPKDYYTNVGGYNVGNGDHTIGLGFLMSGVSAGDIVHFNYAYIFGPSAFGAATSAVSGGAGGGTPGTVPGGGTLVDVGSATDAASAPSTPTPPPAPTVTGTSTSTITISDVTAVSATLPVITASLAHHEASESTGVQTIARETTTNVTTPMERTLVTKVRTTSTWSDSTTTFVDAAPVTAITVSNSVATSVANASFSGRVDQYTQLAELNTGINRGLNSQLFRKDMVDGKGYRMYMGVAHLDSSAGNGYDAKSDKFNIGIEKDVKEYWTLGAQYTNVNTSLTGVDSATKQNKNHYGAYSFLTRNNWILKTDLGLADNSLNSNRNVAGLFYNASSIDGNDWWLSNRVYTPSLKGFRPYAGYTYGKDKRDAYTETGSIQSARTVAGVTETNDYAEVGVRYDKTINKLILSGEAGVSSDSYKDIKGEVSYLVNPRSRISITASRQEHKDLSTNQIGLQGKIDF
jgi:hypothetical protein